MTSSQLFEDMLLPLFPFSEDPLSTPLATYRSFPNQQTQDSQAMYNEYIAGQLVDVSFGTSCASVDHQPQSAGFESENFEVLHPSTNASQTLDNSSTQTRPFLAEAEQTCTKHEQENIDAGHQFLNFMEAFASKVAPISQAQGSRSVAHLSPNASTSAFASTPTITSISADVPIQFSKPTSTDIRTNGALKMQNFSGQIEYPARISNSHAETNFIPPQKIDTSTDSRRVEQTTLQSSDNGNPGTESSSSSPAKNLLTFSNADKIAERRRRNRESSSKCYYNRKRIKDELEAQISSEKRLLMQLYDKALELRHENARLKRAIVTSGISLPIHKKTVHIMRGLKT